MNQSEHIISLRTAASCLFPTGRFALAHGHTLVDKCAEVHVRITSHHMCCCAATAGGFPVSAALTQEAAAVSHDESVAVFRAGRHSVSQP